MDDDSLMRGIIRSVLMTVMKGGQDLMMAASGPEAISYATRRSFRLILLDLKMPGMNGLVTCKALRELPGCSETSIMILSGVSENAARLAAERVGANGFIEKPFQPVAMLRTIAPFLAA